MPLPFAIYKPHQCTFIKDVTLRRIFEIVYVIVYVMNFISSPVINQMNYLIFLHNLPFIYKIQFLSSKIA